MLHHTSLMSASVLWGKTRTTNSSHIARKNQSTGMWNVDLWTCTCSLTINSDVARVASHVLEFRSCDVMCAREMLMWRWKTTQQRMKILEAQLTWHGKRWPNFLYIFSCKLINVFFLSNVQNTIPAKMYDLADSFLPAKFVILWDVSRHKLHVYVFSLSYMYVTK